MPSRQVKRSFGSKRLSRRGLNDESDDKHRWNQSHPPIDRGKSQLPDADRGAVRVARRAARQLAHSLRSPCRARRREGLVLRADDIGYELALAIVEPDPEAERVAYAWDAVAAALGNHPHFIRTVLEQNPSGCSTETPSPRSRTVNNYTLRMTGDLSTGFGRGPTSSVAEVTSQQALTRRLPADQ
ncbi:hypothetical protein [Streptomyces sp. NBC_01306]|uniref:hypothetical protein n=1 Tax=Streptomyces sp. NBC_01306 TaxID=2903819 RepID=UPI00224EB945|nr:hypothetical protein [Streptomyces sp. NBC_01306]MCX4729275.1 hypothetical protein [Streptomyces sp. NBC_01306]